MGLSHPVTFVSSSSELSETLDWPRPPKLSRHWYAIVSADDETTLAWRTRTLKGALDGIGLRSDLVADMPGRAMVGRPAMDVVRVADGWTTTLVLRRWPREVAPGWLGQALAEDIPVDLAIHVAPQDAQRVARFAKRQRSWQTSDDAADALGRQDADDTRRALIARTDRPVRVAITATVFAATREMLKQRVETLRHTVGLNPGADLRVATYEQDIGFDSTQTAECRVRGAWHMLNCTSVASTWMWQPVTVSHANGAQIATTRDGAMEVRLDPFDPSLESFSVLVVGKTGVGKSYLLKLIIRRLRDVEVHIVERRNPSEYAGTPNAHVCNLAGIPTQQVVSRLREYITALWNEAKANPKPRLLILDELWKWLKEPELADLVEEVAREGRSAYLSLLIATQQVRELLASGEAVLDNAPTKIYLKQNDNDLDKLCDAVGLPVPARRFLRSAGRGAVLLDISGMLVPIDVQATPQEHRLITTDPRELYGRTDDGTGVAGLSRLVPAASDAMGRAADLVAGGRADRAAVRQ